MSFKTAFFTNYITNCSMRSRLSIYHFFQTKSIASSYRKMNRELMKWRVWLIPVQAWIGWVWPSYLFHKHGNLSFLSYFSKQTDIFGHLTIIFKKKFPISFLPWGITLRPTHRMRTDQRANARNMRFRNSLPSPNLFHKPELSPHRRSTTVSLET